MEISHSEYSNCDLLHLSGRLDSYTASSLSTQLSRITNSGRFNIILDVQDLTYISSAGMRVLLDSQKTCQQAKRGETILLGVSPRVLDTLTLTGFLHLFQVFNDKQSAICYFG